MRKIPIGQRPIDRNSINKDPFYKTNDIFNGVYGKKVRLQGGPQSKTDCHSDISVNFNQRRTQEIEHLVRAESQGSNVYQLACGHEFVSAEGKDHPVGKRVPCLHCGANDAYLSLEHEWSHIIFKSSPILYTNFVNQYATQCKVKKGWDIDPGFLFELINALDDLRVTSLWGLVYPGSAERLVEKWKRICEERSDLNFNLTALIFGVGLQAKNVLHQGGPLSDLIPVISKAVDMVRGKGAANMLVIVRWFLDECVNKMMQRQPPPPPMPPKPQPPNLPPPPQGGPRGQQGHQQDGQEGDKPGESQPQGGDPTDDQGGEGSGSGDEEESPDAKLAKLLAQQKAEEGRPDPTRPADDREAIKNLQMGSRGIQSDAEQGHHKPEDGEEDPLEHANRLALQKVLNADTDDVEDAVGAGSMDQDVHLAVEKLKQSAKPKNSSQFLLNDAKSKILLVDVPAINIRPACKVELGSEERIHVARMRAAFAQVMGKIRQSSDSEGTDVDVQSAIQFLMDPNEDDIFDVEEQQKGFYYNILCDMSGSMGGGRFDAVSQGATMLKEALDYPFVRGDVWGFRGGENISRGNFSTSVWLYKYHQDCEGFEAYHAEGTTQNGKKVRVPVECGGLTPLHTAIHVAVKYTNTHVPSGMDKRIIVLTDGDPTQFTTKSRSLSGKFLKGLVHKEIQDARQKGIQVYAIIIGNTVDEETAKIMFGSKKYWERTGKRGSISKALSSLVIREFTKYLRSK